MSDPEAIRAELGGAEAEARGPESPAPPAPAPDLPPGSAAAPPAQPSAAGEAAPPGIRERIIEALHTVYDPEIPVDIYELGLVYEVAVDAEGAARIQMTLTSPSCPAAEQIPPEVETKARSVEGVRSVAVELVWDPPWTPERMSEAARLELGMV